VLLFHSVNVSHGGIIIMSGVKKMLLPKLDKGEVYFMYNSLCVIFNVLRVVNKNCNLVKFGLSS
jgi:hypothetical protein